MGEARTEDSGKELVAGVVTFLAKEIVEVPDDVSVETIEEADGFTYRLTVNPDDLGRVIGRGGKIARALRQVTRAAGHRVDLEAYLDIVDDD